MDVTKPLAGSPDIGKRDVVGFCDRRHISIIDWQICAAGNLIEGADLYVS
jgi:hypothetical protein